MYPRYELFKQVTDVFRADGRAVPVFNDKHLSWKWAWAKEMVDISKELKFAFTAGSSLPVTWRLPDTEIALGTSLVESVAVGYGGRREVVDAVRSLLHEHATHGTSLDELAADTRVKREHLEALENNDLSAWPRGLYARAWIRAYASSVGLDPIDTPFTALMVPLLLGALVLGPRTLPWFLAWMALMLAVAVALQPDKSPRILGASAIQTTMILIVLAVSVRRGRLGVGGMAGESMFVDLRDPRELEREGKIPGAFHCPRGMLEFWIDPESPYHKPVFAENKKFVFYCASGWRCRLFWCRRRAFQGALFRAPCAEPAAGSRTARAPG